MSEPALSNIALTLPEESIYTDIRWFRVSNKIEAPEMIWGEFTVFIFYN